MFKIFGRLLGLKGEELKYNREILIFMLITSLVFIFLAFSHTKTGANIIYNNSINKMFLIKGEKDGISETERENYIYKFKETIPINIREYRFYEIKDRLENYISDIKKDNNKNMNEIIYELENISKSNNKELILDRLQKINLNDMLEKVSKKYIINRRLEDVVKWQYNIFIADIYFIIGIFIGTAFMIIKVFSDIKLLDRNEKKVNVKCGKNIKK